MARRSAVNNGAKSSRSSTSRPVDSSLKFPSGAAASSSSASPPRSLETSADYGDASLWAPTFETAVSLLLLPRVISAVVNPIADCDETFNYWEPLHYLVYGFGFQTWEYSPVYALRSYLYLLLHGAIAKVTTAAIVVGNVLGDPFQVVSALVSSSTAPTTTVSKVIVFYGVRGALALVCCYCEALFYRATIKPFGRRTARYLLWLLIWNAGMFHASTALLPSSFVMYLIMLLLAAWMDSQHWLAIFWGVVAVLCGWPYVGALFLPFMIDTMATRGVLRAVLVGACIGVAVLLAELGVNWYYYRRLVLPAWNIVQYNVLSNETDSTLYGTEPASFYVRNLMLNFNVAALLAAPAALLVITLPSSVTLSRRLAFLSPLAIWLAIMFAQAHKEERFLFPVYALLCLGAAISLSAVSKTLATAAPALRRIVVYSTLALYAALSVSRVVSNVVNYSAPLRVFQHLHDHVLPSARTDVLSSTSTPTPVTLCIGKEWYRFPTSFFIPTDATAVRFLRSSFTGQLPKPFEPLPHGTSVVPTHMNNRNAEEPSRYVPITSCDYVVDLDLPDQQETKFWEFPETWQRVHQEPFLDAARSPSPYRALYVPFWTPQRVTFTSYSVYRRCAQTQKPQREAEESSQSQTISE
ncbi:hypothetical protein PINS_up012006 [Pythium insidiosum]|nr:hypothetical protein PINS_up012006 [Pythium insidiosum]